MKEGYLKFKKTFLEKYWPDPVWSKVISAVIIAVGGSILTAFYVLVKSLYEKIPFETAYNQLLEFLSKKTEVNNLLIWILILVVFATFLKFFITFIKDIVKKVRSKTKKNEESDEVTTITQHSTSFFWSRLAQAFPGQRGLQWYDSKSAVKRLVILLQKPLRFESTVREYVGDPIWWFRGGRAMFVEKFDCLSKTKVLMGVDELEINRIGVFISDSYYKSFVYVEAKGEKQTGLYNYSSEDFKRHIESFGYSSEEFGLLGKKPINRNEYDDGATVIKGKVVDATGAELRVRYLSDYNFIIAAKQSPYNSKRFDRETRDMFNNLLKGVMTPNEFFEYLDSYEKYDSLG